MALTAAARRHADEMGSRAGADWRRTGVPTPNPFDQDTHRELAETWRRAYFAAAGRG